MGERRGRPSADNVQDFAPSHDGRKTREIVAEKAGFGNAETYRQAKAVVNCGVDELVKAMDAGDVSISAAAVIAKQAKSVTNCYKMLQNG